MKRKWCFLSYALFCVASTAFAASADLKSIQAQNEKLTVSMAAPVKGESRGTIPAIPEGAELTLGVRLLEKGFFEIGDGTVNFSVQAMGADSIRTQFFKQRVDHNLRGIVNDSFGWDSKLLSWSKYLHYAQPELKDRDINLRVLHGKNGYEYYVNGYYAGTSGQTKKPFTIKSRNAEIVSSVLWKNPAQKPKNPAGLFTTLDLSSKFNHQIGFKANTLPENQVLLSGEVPFFLAKGDKRGNVLDLSPSWVRFGNQKGTEGFDFGGRWGHVWTHSAASINSPTRFRFRVPQADYSTLHVLCATQKNIREAIPSFTVQFYRAGAGYPIEFKSGDVPLLTDKGTLEIDGKHLHHIQIDLKAGSLKEFADSPYLEFELTKNTEPYQSYPDPFYYSRHGAGLPSGVKVFGLTLEKSPVKVSFEPENVGNVWNAPETITYNLSLSPLFPNTKGNFSGKINTVSWDGKETTEKTFSGSFEKSVDPLKVRLNLKKYGHHKVTLTLTDAKGKVFYQQDRTLAYLRERKPVDRPFEHPGHQFGFWNWNGGHYSLGGAPQFEIMGRIGMNAVAFGKFYPGTKDYEAAKKWFIRNYFAGDCWPTHDLEDSLKKKAEQQAKNDAALLKREGLDSTKQSPVNELDKGFLFAFGTEPSFGVFSHGSLPHYYGEKEIDPFTTDTNLIVAGGELASAQGPAFVRMRDGLRKSIPLLKKKFPEYKVMVPWGDPNFGIPFMKEKDLAPLIDGVLYDSGVFDRIPEMQLHQTVIHRLWQFRQEWKKYSDKEPLLVSIEGPCFAPVTEGALTEKQHAEYLARAILLLSAHGMRHQFSVSGAACSDYWGEQHYGSGIIGRYATLNPYAGLSAVSTMARHLSNAKFVRAVPMKSSSVYCSEYVDVNDPKKTFYVLWCPIGSYSFPLPGSGIRTFDLMDNEFPLENGKLTVTTAPVFVYGLTAPIETVAGRIVPDHSDSKQGEFVAALPAFNTANWKQTADEDADYMQTLPNHIRRFRAEMTIENDPVSSNGQGLVITLPKQQINRGTMPHFTTLVPNKSIPFAGSPKTINFLVNGNGDWGRIVLVLKDAEGKKWISSGHKNEWNVDDTKSQSTLNFEGLRRLKIDLPQNAPWDGFRRSGTASWACYSDKDNEEVTLPLSLEKIMIERREQFIQVNDMVKPNRDSILLHSAEVEYAAKQDMTPDAVRLGNLRMGNPPANYTEPNPIETLRKLAEDKKIKLPPARVVKVEEPPTYNDGSNGIFHFAFPENMLECDVYMGMKESGEGAKLMARNVKTPQSHIRGFKGETDFYVFLVYRTKDKQQSAPSAPFKFRMKKNFGNL